MASPDTSFPYSSKLWALCVRFLEGPGYAPTYLYQKMMPKQPLPELNKTLDRYTILLYLSCFKLKKWTNVLLAQQDYQVSYSISFFCITCMHKNCESKQLVEINELVRRE